MLGLCPECSYKLNYKQQRQEVRKKARKRLSEISDSEEVSLKKHKVDESKLSESEEESSRSTEKQVEDENNIWKNSAPVLEEKPRDEEFEEYLNHLFL